MHARNGISPFCLAALAVAFKAWRMATSRLPKQIEPKEVVIVRMNELKTLASQQSTDEPSGSNHHVPTVPATVT